MRLQLATDPVRLPLTLATVVAVVAGCASATDESAAAAPKPTIERMLVVSDGDYLASTYADNRLTPQDAGSRDLLSTVTLRDGEVATGQVEVSNSVTAPPEVLALSPDGTTAFVTERTGTRPPGATTTAELPTGTRLFAVDVRDFANPAVTETLTVAAAPEALAISPDGTTVAVVSNTPEASVLQLIPWSAAGFGEPASFDLADLGVTGDAPGPRGGVLATNVQWHPDGQVLAVNITTQNRVAFLDLAPGGGLTPRGTPVDVGVDPFVGRFTPDGRHYLTSNWGRDFTASTIEDRLPDTPSDITVIEVGAGGSAPRVIQSIETDRSAEGLAVSPDGMWVATVNMRGTALPSDSAKYDEGATVTLLRRDTDTGMLTKIDDFPFDAVLPEGGAFDPSGRYFVATSYEARAGSDVGSGLQIFEVGSAESPGLTAVQRIPLPQGAHHVVIG